MPWANKPGVAMHARVLASEAAPAAVLASPFRISDPALLDDLYRLCVENPVLRWQWHANEPPYPTRKQFQFYFDRGNPIVVVFDVDDEVWFFRINSKKNHEPLWGHFRRELDELHDEWESSPFGGMTDNSRETFAHGTALTWALAGEILPPFLPGGGENEDVNRADAENRHRLRARATQLYNTVYGQQIGG